MHFPSEDTEKIKKKMLNCRKVEKPHLIKEGNSRFLKSDLTYENRSIKDKITEIKIIASKHKHKHQHK